MVEIMLERDFTARPPKTRHWLYGTYVGIKQRCFNPKASGYRHHGGNGIGMSDEWRENYWQFVSDVGNPPQPRHTLPKSEQHTIVRIDPNLGFERGNTMWLKPRLAVWTSSFGGPVGLTNNDDDYSVATRIYGRNGAAYRLLVEQGSACGCEDEVGRVIHNRPIREWLQ